MTLALVTLCTTAFIVMVGFNWNTVGHVADMPHPHYQLRMNRKEPEVIVFKEPVFKERKRGREAAKERERFLVRFLSGLTYIQSKQEPMGVYTDQNHFGHYSG